MQSFHKPPQMISPYINILCYYGTFIVINKPVYFIILLLTKVYTLFKFAWTLPDVFLLLDIIQDTTLHLFVVSP